MVTNIVYNLLASPDIAPADALAPGPSNSVVTDSRKRCYQYANSRRQSDTAHLADPPETPTESETSQSPYSIGPLQHYFYDLRNTRHR